jgi:hypothetical protein
MALSADSARTGATTDRILNKLAFAIANKADDIGTATTSDRIPMVDASADYAVKYADGDNVLEMAGITATAAEINAAADVSSGLVSITDAADYTALAANSGKTHVFPDLTATCTVDLPAAAAGLEYTFIGKAVATEAQNWAFDTGAAANFYLGGLQFLDSDEPGSGSTLVPVYPDGNSNDIMTIITPQAGTRVHMICDGTNWIVSGVVYSATAPTFAD